MFDLTREVKLDEKNNILYGRLQIVIYVLAVIFILYLAYLIIFPTQYFSFSFPNPNSTQNTVIDPRNTQRIFLDHGNFDAADAMFFDAAIAGNYSQANIQFTLDKKSDPIETASITARKSYQALFYPEGDAIGFKDGTLLRNENNYYIVSDGKLRKFVSVAAVDSLGFSRNAFIEAGNNDLKYNEPGENVQNYPDASLFKIKDEYYILAGQKMKKFVSPASYLTQYSESQAIVKDESFLKKYPIDEKLEGFRDGTLVSYGISVFIISSGRLLPVNNVITFTSMGYDWNDVIPVSGDEISLYEKDKLFTLSGAHPAGTVFFTNDEKKWYIISDNQKHFLPSENIARSWLVKGKPVFATQKSMGVSENCQLAKTYSALNFRTFSCQMPLDNFQDLIGKDYEFKLTSDNDIKIETINVAFEKTATWPNFKQSIRDLLTRVKANYGATQ